MNFYSSTSVLEGRLQEASTVYTYKSFRDLDYQHIGIRKEGENEEKLGSQEVCNGNVSDHGTSQHVVYKAVHCLSVCHPQLTVHC